MEITNFVQPQASKTLLNLKSRPVVFDEEKFFPRGAIAFFIVLVALGLIIWFGIYFLMLERV